MDAPYLKVTHIWWNMEIFSLAHWKWGSEPQNEFHDSEIIGQQMLVPSHTSWMIFQLATDHVPQKYFVQNTKMPFHEWYMENVQDMY